ncbi:hypothetical protein [Streptomyces sp. NPDC002779]|uniref:hypothetical protein n=1 Tax=Streptomyces sp. NPDC002779 TaxID=3364664 RepID=UPI003693A8C7
MGKAAMWPLEEFTVFDDARIHVELLAAKVTVTAPDKLKIYVRAFARLIELAEYGADARVLILKAIETLHSPRRSHRWRAWPADPREGADSDLGVLEIAVPMTQSDVVALCSRRGRPRS